MANYVSPNWTNNQAPALNATNLKLLTDTVAANQILEGSGNPSTSTVGTIGQQYRNTTSDNLFVCIAASGGTYTWIRSAATREVDITPANGSSNLITSGGVYTFSSPSSTVLYNTVENITGVTTSNTKTITCTDELNKYRAIALLFNSAQTGGGSMPVLLPYYLLQFSPRYQLVGGYIRLSRVSGQNSQIVILDVDSAFSAMYLRGIYGFM